MVSKLHRTSMTNGIQSVATAAGMLAGKDPVGAIELLERTDPIGEIESVLPWIASGISEEFGDCAERALLDSQPETLARLVCAARPLAESIVKTRSLVERLGEVLLTLTPMQFTNVRQAVLPLLNEDAIALLPFRY